MSHRTALVPVAALLLVAGCPSPPPHSTEGSDAATPPLPSLLASTAALAPGLDARTDSGAPEESSNDPCDPWIRKARKTGSRVTLPADYPAARPLCEWRIDDALSTNTDGPRFTGVSLPVAKALLAVLESHAGDVKKCRPSDRPPSTSPASELGRELHQRIRLRAWFGSDGRLGEIAFQTAAFGHGTIDKSTHICISTALARDLRVSPASSAAIVTYTYRFEP
jgi:hypothetical protein